LILSKFIDRLSNPKSPQNKNFSVFEEFLWVLAHDSKNHQKC
jgi:hypothetical protein